MKPMTMKTSPCQLAAALTLLMFALPDSAVAHGGRGYGGRGFGRSRHDHAGHSYTEWFASPGVKDWAAYIAQEDLKSGRTRQRILTVQRSLAAQGFYRGPKNGVLDAETRRAIKRFQGSDDQPVTGNLDAGTWVALGFKAADGPRR